MVWANGLVLDWTGYGGMDFGPDWTWARFESAVNCENPRCVGASSSVHFLRPYSTAYKHSAPK
jgi:hypothetical protein